MEVKPGYKQTKVGVIPEEWDADNLGRFWGVTDCKHVTAQFVPQGFPLASIREVQSSFVDLTNAKQTTAHFYNLLIEGGRKPRPGDLILSRNATVGEIAQVAEWHPPFAMGQDVCLLRKKSNEHSTEFLQSVFQSPVILKQLADLMVGSTFKRANVQQIRNFAVPMPPPPEQRAIATALSDVDGLLGGLDRLIAKKRDLKQAAMQQLLTGKTRLPGFRGEWEVKRLGDIGNFRNGINKAKEDFGHGFPFANLMDVFGVAKVSTNTSFGLVNSTLGERELYELKKGDVLFVRSSVKPTGVGLTTLVVEDLQNAVFSGFLLRFRDEGWLVTEYKEHCFGEAGFRNRLIASSTVSANTNINQVSLKALMFTFPPERREQTAIAEVLTDMDAELSGLEQRREKTRALKQAMMQELLTGRIRLI